MAFATGPAGPRWPRRRVLAATAVLGTHLLLLWVLWHLKQPARPHGKASVSIPIRFVPDRQARVRPADEQVAATRARVRTPPVQTPVVIPPVEPGVEAVAPSVSEATSSTGAIGQSGPLAGTPGNSASAPGALTLKPSREVMLGSLSNPATTDPRSNTPKPTFEERIAMGLDPELCVKVERLPNGEIRRRMGKMVNAQSAIQNTHGTGPHGIKVCQ
ncbi:hypothetical protein [Pelomonas cellulosilytica]|uniref:Uncharacterized protein n=1 Tax=Pelomonas cellulosilytica TaxID=2906762 RepID=A0ABS8XPN2_9BURK|nr:hypothetical protein [Pelomonas sp. P8]MCE4554702.1 hypothetical protein [Pelomonas sp. P8]